MRICHVISTIDPDNGGPPVIATRLACAQAALGHDVTLLTYEDSEKTRAEWEQTRDMLPGGKDVEVVFLPMGGARERFCAPIAAQALRDRLPKIDALHLHNVWESILRIAGREARQAKVPYMILLNGMLDEHSMGNKSLKKKFALAFGYRSLFNGASILHVGNTVEEDLMRHLELSPPVHIVPNGISFEEIDPLPEEGTFRAAYPDLGDAPFILFLSRLQYKKGLDYLADAFIHFAKSDDMTHLVVAGPDEGMREEFERRIGEANLNARVHVVGAVYGRMKYAAFRDALCFCLPTRQEGFSVVVNETMACGLPAVISEGAHRPDLGEAGGGLIVPLNAEAVGDALLRLVGDPAEREAMSKAGREFAESNLTWRAVAETLVEAYGTMSTDQAC